MSNPRQENQDNIEIHIDNKKVELDKNDEVQDKDFKVSTTGPSLLSGIINKPVTVKNEFTGPQLTGTVDEIIAMLSHSPGLKK